jgi:hypothetical protein
MDVIKTRLMAQGKEGAGGGQRYSGLFDALVKIPQQEGVTALWRGLLPRLMRIPPGQVGVAVCARGVCGGGLRVGAVAAIHMATAGAVLSLGQ